MLRAFHSNWTKPFFVRGPERPYWIEPFELLTTALSALMWRKENGPIRMICDSAAKKYYEDQGLVFLWDEGVHTLLDLIPEYINPMAFWAGGKLYALAAMPSPCVMIDTDFIVWKPLMPLLSGLDAAAIHREDIMPDIYPGAEAFSKTRGFPLYDFDWNVKPFNTALSYFGTDSFRHYYVDTAINFMRSSREADNVLTYMVFAEQRLLSMCAEKKKAKVRALSELSALFSNEQSGYYTHIWGFKQQMRDEPLLYEDFCRRCASRLKHDFPEEAESISNVKSLSKFF